MRCAQVDGTLDSPFISKDQRRYIEDTVESVLLFDSLTSDVSDSTDALAVLFKR
jgi:hypothetical protein